MAERIDNAFLECWAEFLHLAWMARHGKTLFLPEMSPYSGECVAEGGAAFVIPGRAHDGPACLRAELCGEQGDEGEEPEQARGGACDSQVGPLALGLNAQMRPGKRVPTMVALKWVNFPVPPEIVMFPRPATRSTEVCPKAALLPGPGGSRMKSLSSDSAVAALA